MKKFLGIVVLGLFLITPSQADDIRDFQIEGMSIGDSALDYFSEDKLNETKEYYVNSNSRTFFLTNAYSSNFETYDNIMFHFKDNDPKYIIHSISGAVFFENNGLKSAHCKKPKRFFRFLTGRPRQRRVAGSAKECDPPDPEVHLAPGGAGHGWNQKEGLESEEVGEGARRGFQTPFAECAPITSVSRA